MMVTGRFQSDHVTILLPRSQ